MKKNNLSPNIFLLILVIAIIPLSSIAQYDSRNGAHLPVRGTVKILLIFAEVVPDASFSGCSGCLGTTYAPFDPTWPSGPSAPPNANNYIDPLVTTNPQTFLTRYYKNISLGEYDVIGDYYDGTVQVPCSIFCQQGLISAITVLNSIWTLPYTTKHGLTLSDFDDYNNQGLHGQYKPPGSPDGLIDAVVIIWRNKLATYPIIGCGSGYGIGNTFIAKPPLGNKQCYLYGSWGGCQDNWSTSFDGNFVQEYFHAMMGGNNFHTGGGEDPGTFMFDATGSYSTSAQANSVSNIVCGWDRWYLDWKGSRQNVISALNLAGQEENSDLSISTHPSSSFYILRDFVTVGDAVRIKLPHFNWQAIGDVKNQYLWIENHQVGMSGSNEFDYNKEYGNCGSWASGLYVQLQAGKDQGYPYTYGGFGYGNPNQLNDWLFPLHKEGNWDYFYSYIDKGTLGGGQCAWNGKSLPYSIQFPSGTIPPTLSNAFTGYNDSYGYIDSDFNGKIDGNDIWQPRYQKWPNTPTITPPSSTLPLWGDNLDAFTDVNDKISIATNPAPMPVYTLIQQNAANPTSPANYDNRTIRLNNVAITILDNDYYNVGSTGNNAYLIKVDWDDNTVDNDVRWCGNIVLENDPLDPSTRTMQIDLAPGKVITLDRGLSPTKVVSSGGFFTEPTFLHLLNGTATTLENNSTINVINGSTLHVQDGAIVIIGPGATINVDATSAICIEPGADIIFQNPATSRIIINGNTYYNFHSLLGTILQNTTSNNYHSYTNIMTGNNGITPTTMVSSGLVELEAKTDIKFGVGTHLVAANSGNKLWAHINFPSNCSSVNNFRQIEAHSNEDIPYTEYAYTDLGSYYDRNQITDEVPFQENNRLLIYPNPSSGEVNIKSSDSKIQAISVYNSLGIETLTKQFYNISTEVSIDLSKEKEGLYFLLIKVENESYWRKLLKKPN